MSKIHPNAIDLAFKAAFSFGWHEGLTSGLNFGYYGGVVQPASGDPITLPDAAIALAASSTNYVELNQVTGQVVVNQTGWTDGFFKIAKVVTNSTGIVAGGITDFRSALVTPIGTSEAGGSVNFTDACDTVVGWTAGGLGTLASTGGYLYASGYGTGAGDHGPTATRTLTTPVEDFTANLSLIVAAAAAAAVGKVLVEFVDSTGAVMAGLYVGDTSGAASSTDLYGNNPNGSYVFQADGTTKTYLANTQVSTSAGVVNADLVVTRTGSTWTVTLAGSPASLLGTPAVLSFSGMSGELASVRASFLQTGSTTVREVRLANLAITGLSPAATLDGAITTTSITVSRSGTDQTLTANEDPVIWNTAGAGALTGYNVSNGVFTAPTNGVYQFDASIKQLAGSSTPGELYLTLIKNGVKIRHFGVTYNSNTSGDQNLVCGTTSIELAVGDTIAIGFGFINLNSPFYVVADSLRSFMVITRVGAGTLTGNASEVAMRSTGGSATANNTLATFTETLDARGEFNPTTGVFTAARAGVYLFGLGVRWATAAAIQLNYSRNGGANTLFAESTATGAGNGAFSVLPIQLAAGDTISFSPSVAATNAALSATYLGTPAGGSGGGSSTAAFAQLFGLGDVASMVGAVCDYHVINNAKNLQTVVLTVGTTPSSGVVTFDIFKNGSTIFPVTKPTVACNGGRGKTKQSVNVACAALDELEIRILSAPAGCSDFRADFYDS